MLLAAILPQPIGSLIEIPSGNYDMKRIVEAYGFWPVRDDRRTLILRRDFPDHGLGGAAISAREEMPGSYVEVVRANLRVVRSKA
jgi:hypothetical protein